MKAKVRDVEPEIKTELRKVVDKLFQNDPELKAKLLALYMQNPLLKKLYEEAGFDERPRD